MASLADQLAAVFADPSDFAVAFGDSIAGVGGDYGRNSNTALTTFGNQNYNPTEFGVGPTNGVDRAGKPMPTAGDAAYPGAFSPQFRDNLDPSSDQSHHFAAFMELGFFAGTRLSDRYAEQIDAYPHVPMNLDNPGDVALGKQGAMLGSLLSSGDISPRDVGDWIRRNICNPTGTP